MEDLRVATIAEIDIFNNNTRVNNEDWGDSTMEAVLETEYHSEF